MNNWGAFLWDVFWCALSSYGGPEAHYGIFSRILVEDKGYLTEEELTELIGLYSLVPGPGSSQVITAIGYHVGGPGLAIFTFLLWAMPAIIIMSLVGVFFGFIDGNQTWEPLLTYMPAAAVAFIIYAAVNMSKKAFKKQNQWLLYGISLFLAYFFAGQSVWGVPLLLIASGLSVMLPHLKDPRDHQITIQPRWWLLMLIIFLAISNEVLAQSLDSPWMTTFTSFYRYGYSAMGGGQVVIPLMIQDLVESQSLLSLSDFLSGYAIDQVVPGPLFSFAAFVGARAFAGSTWSFMGGLVSGLAIFTPGILLVYFMFPLWQSMRQHDLLRYFLKGVTVAVAGLITATAIHQVLNLPADGVTYLVLVFSTLALLSKGIPAPLLVLVAAGLGFIL